MGKPRFQYDLAGSDSGPADPHGWFVLDSHRGNRPVPGSTGLTREEAVQSQQDCEALGDDAYGA